MFGEEDDDLLSDLATSEDHTTLMNLLNSNVQPITLEYVYFPLEIASISKKERNGKMKEVLQDSNVSFLLDFHCIEEKKNAVNINISILNTTSQKPVTIPNVVLSHIQDTKILVKVDLNSVPDGYKVRKKSSDNHYKLNVDIHLVNGSTVQQSTRTFQLLQGSTITGNAGGRNTENKRKRPPTADIDFRLETLGAENTTCEDDGLIEARQIVCDHIKTQFLTVDGDSIKIGKTIATPNGDVAYHFHLDKDDRFEEGEVVGLIPPGNMVIDIGGEGKQSMQKLTFESASQALIKGVVTRSQYLEAMKPSSGIISETIAMMGVVPVQVRGRIYANEPLYSSPKYPGFAVSATELDHTQLNEAAFVGYAFTSRQTADKNSTGMVQAAVSILQSCGQKLLSEKVNRLKHQLDIKIEKVDRYGRRTRSSTLKSILVSSVVFIFVSVFLYQLLTPGSALRYYQCQRGRKIPHGKATFSMQPYTDPHLTAVVNGIEFDFEELMVKAGHEEYPKHEIPDVRYYLNIDRCGYGFVTSGDVPRGTKRVRGPTVFTVDEKCFRSHYFNEKLFIWKAYNSASWLDFRNVCCTPRRKWKSCAELKASPLCSTITECDE